MSGRRNTLILAAATGPGAIGLATTVLWQNEDRFDYHEAAREATVVESIIDATPTDAVAYTGSLDTAAWVPGHYVEGFTGYLTVRRHAEIYSWVEHEEEDGSVSEYQSWSPSLEQTSGNWGLTQVLSDASFQPARITLGDLDVPSSGLEYVDALETIDPRTLRVTEEGRRWRLQVEDDYLYLRLDPGETSIGDERLRYEGIRAAPTGTYFGRVEDGIAVGMRYEGHEDFVSMMIQSDGVLHHLVNGDRGEAIVTIRRHLARRKWLVRVLGTIAMTIGFWIVFGRFLSAVYSIPLLGSVAELGAFVLGLLVGVPFALLVIAASLFVHTPALAAIPLTLGVVGVGFLLYRGGVTSAAAKRWQDQELSRRRAKRNLRKGVEWAKERARLATVSPREWEAHLDRLELEDTFQRVAMLACLDDAYISHQERRFLFDWGKRQGLREKVMHAYLSGASTESRKRFELKLDQAPDADDRDDLRLMILVALSDGVISSAEMEALERIGARIGVDKHELAAMIAAVESEPAPA